MSNDPNDGSRDLADSFNQVEAKRCLGLPGEACDNLLPFHGGRFICSECEDSYFGPPKQPHVVYECRRCGRWVEWAETGDHLASHELAAHDAAMDAREDGADE